MKNGLWGCLGCCLAGGLALGVVQAADRPASAHTYLTGVPDYEWHIGCFGTATGNLMGYWDRHGLPDFYTGPTAGGVAPLNSWSDRGIFSLWATKAGRDGRPADQPGHEDDYHVHYESTAPDPYVTAGRAEHAPDCLGDFIGLNQRNWTDMAEECSGNIDGYVFVYWDQTGARRTNHVPGPEAGLPAVDLPSGLRAWTQFKGSDADVFTQLADFNPTVPPGTGFTYADVMAEIDAGYPLLVFLQPYNEFFRSFPGMEKANPSIHAMLIYGYYLADDGVERVYIKNSWGSSEFDFLREWTSDTWAPSLPEVSLPVRGVISYRPKPRITGIERVGENFAIRWHGPTAELYDAQAGVMRQPHWYQVERSVVAESVGFVPVTDPSPELSASVPVGPESAAFFRVRLVAPPSGG
ncbi:MAG: cysteine peptidase family C39 domain-containing protein [Limisphaerales bacterium]